MRIRWAAESSISVSTALESVDVTVQTALMGKKKADEVTTGDNKPEASRKPFKPARIRKALADIAEKRAGELAQDFTQYVNDAVRMRLEQEGRWPPKAATEAVS